MFSSALIASLIMIDNYDAIREHPQAIAKVSEEWRLLKDICLASADVAISELCFTIRKRMLHKRQFSQSTNIRVFLNENARGPPPLRQHLSHQHIVVLIHSFEDNCVSSWLYQRLDKREKKDLLLLW